MCIRGIDFGSVFLLFDFTIRFRKCSESMLFLFCNFLANPFIITNTTWLFKGRNENTAYSRYNTSFLFVVPIFFFK